jgi:hypothetical protein
LVCQTVGGQFFLFCQNYMDAKLVCQTVGVALRKNNVCVKLFEPFYGIYTILDQYYTSVGIRLV